MVVVQEVVGVVALLITLVMEDTLNLMNVVLMVVTVEEEEEDLLVVAVVVEEITMLVIGKMVFIMLDLVTLTLKKSYLVLLKIKK